MKRCISQRAHGSIRVCTCLFVLFELCAPLKVNAQSLHHKTQVSTPASSPTQVGNDAPIESPIPTQADETAHLTDLPMDADQGRVKPPTVVPEPLTPQATDQYWDAIARCETASRWQRDFKFGGGLGIYITAWKQFGGLEFAPRAGLASRTEQIIVANRISTQGYISPNQWHFKPLGFTGWGCARHLTPPILIWHSTSWLLAQQLEAPTTASVLLEIQAALGVPLTGTLDETTRTHFEHAKQRYAEELGFDDLGPYHWLAKKQRRSVKMKDLQVIGQPTLTDSGTESTQP